MRKIIFVLVFLTKTLFALGENIEFAILEEYHGRENRTPLAGVQLKAVGCNWTTTDSEGLFSFNFRNRNTKEVKSFEFIKDGYVVFNENAVHQWRIANDPQKRFRVVLCKQADLVRKVQEYYGVFDEQLRKELQRRKKEVEELKISLKDKELRIAEIEEEYERKSQDIEIYAHNFAHIDENEIIDEEYRALKLFRENKIEEAIKVYEEYDISKKIDDKIASVKEASEAEKKMQEVKEEQIEDLKRMIPMLFQQTEWLKLGGQRNEEIVLSNLQRLVKSYHIVSDTIYNEQLSHALYDLGCIHEPLVINYMSSVMDGGNISDVEARHENPIQAERYFLESAQLGYAPAQYRLGRLYECYIQGVYDITKAKKYYAQAASQGYAPAIDRMDDFFDFGVRDAKGNMIYYHILSQHKKKGTVKITYKDLGYNTYSESVDSISPFVIHKGVTYEVKEIGRHAFRGSQVRHLSIPEGVEKIGYYAFRSLLNLSLIDLPKSLKCIDSEAQAWHCVLKRINIDSHNAYFDVQKDGNLYRKNDNSVALYLDTYQPQNMWDGRKRYIWNKEDGLLARPEKSLIKNGITFYDGQFYSVDIPNDIDTIPDKCFYYTKLKTLTIPANIKEIGNRSFMASNHLVDVLFSKEHGLGTDAFCSCEMLADIYVLSKEVPPADINTFSEGRACRYLHVPKGSALKYADSQGWSGFTHIYDDLEPENPIYNSLLYRSIGHYKEGLNSLDSVISSSNTSLIMRAHCEYLKAWLYLQINERENAYNSLRKAIVSAETLNKVDNMMILDELLNRNLIIGSIFLEDVNEFSLGINTIVQAFEIGVNKKRDEILKTIAQDYSQIHRNIDAIKDDTTSYILLENAVALHHLFDLYMQSHTKQKSDSTHDDFINPAAKLLDLCSQIGVKQSELLRRRYAESGTIEEAQINSCKEFVAFNSDGGVGRALSKLESWLKIMINDVEEKAVKRNIKIANNVAYLLYNMDSTSIATREEIDRIYKWAIENPSFPEADTILLDICTYSNKKLPLDYYSLQNVVSDLENGIILQYVDTSKTNLNLYLGLKAFQNSDYKQAKIHLVRAAYGSPLALRLLGVMCSFGEGVVEDNALAKRFFLLACKKGDVDMSGFLLGRIYLIEEDYESAYHILSLSNYPLSTLYLAQMYEEGKYVSFDLQRAVDLNKSMSIVLADEVEEAIMRIANKYNQIAYEDAWVGNYEDAIKNINSAIELCPGDGNYYDSKGEILLMQGKVDEALIYWNQAIQLEPALKEKSVLYFKLLKLNLIE